MKKLTLCFTMLFLATIAFSQNKFRIDYNYFAIYDTKTETWDEWKKGDNTFVINVNERGDIAHIKGNGKSVIYRKLSGAKDGYTNNGHKHYQTVEALDEDGDSFTFQIFDETNIGLKMIYRNIVIQFKKE